MQRHWQLTLPRRRDKSYVRGDSYTDTIFSFWRYKACDMTIAKRRGTTTRFRDGFAGTLLAKDLITPGQLAAYEQTVCAEYFHKDQHPEQSPEDIYAFVCRAREAHFGVSVLEQAREDARLCPPVPDFTAGIDQREIKQKLLRESKVSLFILCEAALFSSMEEDIRRALEAGNRVFIGVSAHGTGDLPRQSQLERWLQGCCVTYVLADEAGIFAEEKPDCLFFYGEEGFLHCRDLVLPSVVTAIPRGYHAQALCNLLGREAACVVYIPAGLDITPWVPLTARTRLTFHHLARLCREHGEQIYDLSVRELYARYPEAFVNVYENAPLAFPLTAKGDTFAQFDADREAAIGQYLGSFDNLSYTCRYFDEALAPREICFDPKQKQPGILVHSVRVKKAKAAGIIACQKGVTPRQTLEKLGCPAGVVSNFLFFLTPKLGALYNDLRADRPQEQADAAAGHLDYMLCYQADRRVETFPLFQKCCIAKGEDGSFFFFNFRLGGGRVSMGEATFSWKKEDVDPQTPADICVYTPFYSQKDENADRQTYRTLVGQGRVNLVILRDKVTCIRKGDVVLPSVGVVLSLTEEAAQALLSRLRPLEDGYYHVKDLPLQVVLNAPEGIGEARWQQVQWAYGGGMTLIQRGIGLCDGEDMTRWFRRDGWLTPLSRQTQESVLHELVKHPRTAIGTAKNGDLLILVYSGRTLRSSGADYREMISIARSLYPDVENLMNVDGGGSAMLGMTEDGSFMELSYPATSSGSCAGMVRPINTLFYIPAEKENAQ